MIIIVATASIQCIGKMLFLKIFYFLPFLSILIGAFATVRAAFGRGRGPIFLDDVDCNGTELQLTSCRNIGVGIHDCLHSEDAGVVCAGI